MRSRTSGMPHRPLLDALLVSRALEYVLDEDAGRDDVVRIDVARLDQPLDLGDSHLRGGRHDGIEIACSLAVDEIAEAVALPRLHEREIGLQRLLEDVA